MANNYDEGNNLPGRVVGNALEISGKEFEKEFEKGIRCSGCRKWQEKGKHPNFGERFYGYKTLGMFCKKCFNQVKNNGK